jgi:hypothetical protein
MHPWDAIWIFLILSSLQPLVQKQLLALEPTPDAGDDRGAA